MGIKRLSLSDLEESGPRGPVWFLNSVPTSEVRGPDDEILSGEVIISIPKLNGDGGDPLIIEQTWLPADATEHFPKKRLLESAEFRGAVRKGLITLIDESTAHAILTQSGAKEERERLIARKKHVKQAGASRKISDSNVDMYIPDEHGRKPLEEDTVDGTPKVEVFGYDDIDNLAKATAGGLELDDDGLKPSFKLFAERLTQESDISALNAIRARMAFTMAELRHLRDNLPNKPQTVAAIKERMNSRRNKTMITAGSDQGDGPERAVSNGERRRRISRYDDRQKTAASSSSRYIVDDGPDDEQDEEQQEQQHDDRREVRREPKAKTSKVKKGVLSI